MLSTKEKRRRHLRAVRVNARRAIRISYALDDEIRRIHPELATPSLVIELRQIIFSLTRTSRLRARAEIDNTRVYETGVP